MKYLIASLALILNSCSLLSHVDADIELEFGRVTPKPESAQETLETLVDRMLYEYKAAGILRSMLDGSSGDGDDPPLCDRSELLFEIPDVR